MDRQVFRVVVLRRNERKTGLSKWPILYRIVAAQFRGFGRTTLAYDFFRFVSWPQLSSFEGMGKNRRIEPRDNCRPPLCGNNPPARTARVGTRATDTCREEATARGNCRANVRSPCTSIGARKNARAGDVRGAEQTQPETKRNAGFKTRGPVAKQSQAYFGYPGASVIAPCSS